MDANHLAINAEPALSAIDATLNDLLNARSAFSPSNDTRSTILALTGELHAHAEALLDVTGDDMTEIAANADASGRHFRMKNALRLVQRFTPFIYSEADGSAIPLRRFRRAVTEVDLAIRAFSETNDNRVQIREAIEKAKLNLSDLLVVDEDLDRWNSDNITKALDGLLKIMDASMASEEPETPTQMPNQLRQKAADALDELTTRISCLPDHTHGGFEQVRVISGMVFRLRQDILANLFEAIGDTAPYMVRLEAIQQAVSKAKGLKSSVTKTEFASTHQAQDSIRLQIDIVKNMLSPFATSVPEPPKTGFLAALSRAADFAWAD